MIQYLVKNQVDRIQCNDTGKRIYETLRKANTAKI